MMLRERAAQSPRARPTPHPWNWPDATNNAGTKAAHVLHASQGMGTKVWSYEMAWPPMSSIMGTLGKPGLYGGIVLRNPTEAPKGTRASDSQGSGQS